MHTFNAMKWFALFIVFSVSAFADPACEQDAGGTALIVIDMQAIFVTRTGNQDFGQNATKLEQLNKAQVDAIKRARISKVPIIFVEYRGHGATDKRLIEAAGDHPLILSAEKNTDGIFDDKNSNKKTFVEYFRKHKIENLIVTGANGGSCVRQTIEGALKEGCNVTAYTHGIADFQLTKNFIYPFKDFYKFKKAFREVDTLDGTLGDSTPHLARSSGMHELPVAPRPREVHR